jgi:hypothetical protein
MQSAALVHVVPAAPVPAGTHTPSSLQLSPVAQSRVAEHIPPTITEPGGLQAPAMQTAPLGQLELTVHATVLSPPGASTTSLLLLQSWQPAHTTTDAATTILPTHIPR